MTTEIAQLQQQVAELTRQLQQQATSTMPPAERAMYLREQEIAAREAELTAARDRLGGEVKAHRAALISQQTGVPVEKLLEATSIAEMTQLGLDEVHRTLLGDPVRLRAMADLVEKISTGQQTTVPAGAPAVPGSPAATTPPAPAATPAPGTIAPAPNAQPAPGGAAPLGAPAGEQITKQMAGKGAASMAEWLGGFRAATPMSGMSFEPTTQTPDPTATNAAPAPAPVAAPAAPAPVGAPA